MTKAIISSFWGRPGNKTTWRAMWLALSASLIPQLLAVLVSAARPLIDPASMEGRESGLGISVGFGLVILSLVLAFLALKVSIGAYRLGERSWVMWFGLITSILIGLFWMMMIVGEVAFPH